MHASHCTVTLRKCARIYLARVTFNPLHTSCGRIYESAVRPILLYGCETWHCAKRTNVAWRYSTMTVCGTFWVAVV